MPFGWCWWLLLMVVDWFRLFTSGCRWAPLTGFGRLVGTVSQWHLWSSGRQIKKNMRAQSQLVIHTAANAGALAFAFWVCKSYDFNLPGRTILCSAHTTSSALQEDSLPTRRSHECTLIWWLIRWRDSRTSVKIDFIDERRSGGEKKSQTVTQGSESRKR